MPAMEARGCAVPAAAAGAAAVRAAAAGRGRCRRCGRALERAGHHPAPAKHLPGPLRGVHCGAEPRATVSAAAGEGAREGGGEEREGEGKREGGWGIYWGGCTGWGLEVKGVCVCVCVCVCV